MNKEFLKDFGVTCLTGFGGAFVTSFVLACVYLLLSSVGNVVYGADIESQVPWFREAALWIMSIIVSVVSCFMVNDFANDKRLVLGWPFVATGVWVAVSGGAEAELVNNLVSFAVMLPASIYLYQKARASGAT
jgi:hypothetical protein